MIKGSVKKAITVLMCTLMVVVLGIFSISKMKMNLLPEMDLPYMVVVTTYQGASAEEVNDEVTTKLEAVIQQIDGYYEIQSTSYEHYSMIMVEFEYGTNLESAQVSLRESINNLSFAEGVDNPQILRISADMLPVAIVSLAREYEDLTDEEELIETTNWIERDLMTRLEGINGIASVSMSGQSDTLLKIEFDQTELDKYSLTSENVLDVIDSQNINSLIGITFDEGSIKMLYLGDKVAMLNDLKELPILNNGGTVVKLEDLTVDNGIRLVNSDARSYTKTNGKQTVNLQFTMTSTANTVEAVDNVKKEIREIAKEYDNVWYKYTMDQSKYIDQSISSVMSNLLQGALLAIIILFLFLKDHRPTLIVAISIPVSVIAAFVLMYFSGITLNMISMGGLALAVGMLVDNSIVVIENIYRMLKEGKSKTDAAIYGAKQVAGAIASSTITTIIVFLPLLFVEGIIGDVFLDLSYTIIFALMASLVVALTIVPCVGSKILKEEKVKEDSKFIKKMKEIYIKCIKTTLNHKVITSSIIVVLLVASCLLSFSKGFTLLPPMDEGTISLTVVTDGSNTYDEYSKYADKLTEEILSFDKKYIDTVATSYTLPAEETDLMGALTGASSNMNIEFDILLDENHKKSTGWYKNKLTELIKEFDYEGLKIKEENILEVTGDASSTMSAMFASGVSIKLSGSDLYTMEKIANEVVDVIKTVDGVENVRNGISTSSTNIKITVNKEVAMQKGLTQQDVLNNYALASNSLLSQFMGDDDTSYIVIDGVEYEIEVPSNDNVEGMSLKVFGTAEQFLSGFEIFDSMALGLIMGYSHDENVVGDEIYIMDPTKIQTLGYIPFMLNPCIYFTGSKLEYVDLLNGDLPQAGWVSLSSLSKGKVYSGNTANSIAIVEEVSDFSKIYSDGNSRYFTISADIKKGYTTTEVSNKVTEKVNNYIESDKFKAYGSSYKLTFKGENEEVMSTLGDLFFAMMIAIVLVYMVMAIQFQSLKYPFIIIGTIPLAFTGGLLFTWICGMQVSAVTLMGLIVLVGIVVNNGIVLIDYIDVLRKEGKGVREAIIEAGQTRLRPIFMTALTTIFGLLTLALGLENGSELLQPMAIAVIGGLIYSTILTLVFIPVIYEGMNRKDRKKEKELENKNA